MPNRLNVAPDWWDGRRASSFFPEVYYRGDDSLEGHINDGELDRAERTTREYKGLMQLLRPTKGRDILDCPCGQGRHSIALAKHGHFNVTGVDLCPGAVADAAVFAREMQAEGCRFMEGDMRDIRLPSASFDYVLNMFLSFGFFSADADNLQVAAEFHRVLRPGGTLVIHTDVNPDRIADGRYQDRSVRTLRDGSELIIQEHFDDGTRRLEGLWRIKDVAGRFSEERYSVRIYTNDEMEAVLKQAGFRHVAVKVFPPSLPGSVHDAQEIAYLASKE